MPFTERNVRDRRTVWRRGGAHGHASSHSVTHTFVLQCIDAMLDAMATEHCLNRPPTLLELSEQREARSRSESTRKDTGVLDGDEHHLPGEMWLLPGASIIVVVV